MKKKIPKGFKKHIRGKKSFIRKEILDIQKQKELIELIYKPLQDKK